MYVTKWLLWNWQTSFLTALPLILIFLELLRNVALILHEIYWNTRIQMSNSMTKPTKWHVHPAKTQISQCICPVWSKSSLCAQWIARGPRFLHADSERLWSDWEYAQAVMSLCWAHRSFHWFCHAAVQIIFTQTGFGKQQRPRSDRLPYLKEQSNWGQHCLLFCLHLLDTLL